MSVRVYLDLSGFIHVHVHATNSKNPRIHVHVHVMRYKKSFPKNFGHGCGVDTDTGVYLRLGSF